ncbi:MAG: thioredoxin family protein [Oligoflexales bacterium]
MGKPESGTELEELSSTSFKELVENASATVLVEFGGPSCAPCVAMEPMLVSLANEQAQRASIYKMDVEANPEIAQNFGIRGLPTFLLFKGGKVVERLIGAQSRRKLEDIIKRHS